MDWPISWQKVKDSGAVIFDIADYGLVLDPNNPETMKTTNVAIMSDVEQASKDGKIVYVKADTNSIGFPAHVVCPIMMYSFGDSVNGKLVEFSAVGYINGRTSGLLVIDVTSVWTNDELDEVKLTIHSILEDPISD